MLIVTVCRSGPEYGAEQARFLHDQLKGYESVCLTDLNLPGIRTLPLRYPKVSGWWSKMELFDTIGPLNSKPFLYIDLDTKILADLNPLFDAVRGKESLVMLQDFYRPTALASGVMYVPPECKYPIWSSWRANYRQFMSDRLNKGDGGVIEKLYPWSLTWQCLAPGKIISYKRHVVGPDNRWYRKGMSEGNGSMPEGAVLCCYHGKPRPWRTE